MYYRKSLRLQNIGILMGVLALSDRDRIPNNEGGVFGYISQYHPWAPLVPKEFMNDATADTSRDLDLQKGRFLNQLFGFNPVDSCSLIVGSDINAALDGIGFADRRRVIQDIERIVMAASGAELGEAAFKGTNIVIKDKLAHNDDSEDGDIEASNAFTHSA